MEHLKLVLKTLIASGRKFCKGHIFCYTTPQLKGVITFHLLDQIHFPWDFGQKGGSKKEKLLIYWSMCEKIWWKSQSIGGSFLKASNVHAKASLMFNLQWMINFLLLSFNSLVSLPIFLEDSWLCTTLIGICLHSWIWRHNWFG